MRRACVFAAVVFGLSIPAWATPVTLTVDPAQSSVNMQLCMTIGSTRCDDDTSPVTGTIVAGLNCLTSPTTVTIHDFDLALTHNLVFSLNWGFPTGAFNATASNTALHYSTPGTPQPPAPLTAGAFTAPGIPVDATGSLQYATTLLVCAAFTGAGQPCSTTIDLSTLVLNPVTLTGTITVTGRTIAMTANVNVTGPIDAANPTLGTVTMTGTLHAAGTVPLPSVSNFIGALMGTVTAPDLICESDINADGLTNGRDVQAYVKALLGP